MPPSVSRRKLLDLAHEVRNCSSALEMTLGGLRRSAELATPRTVRILEGCAKQLVAVSRALDAMAASTQGARTKAAETKAAPKRRRAIKGSV
jgi:hypothetical protein